MEKPNFYSILIPHVRYHKKLSWFDKIMYSEISCLTNTKGYCFATNNYFQKVFNVSRSTVQRSLNNLQDNDCIKIEFKDNNQKQFLDRKIYLNLAGSGRVKNDTPPRVKNDTLPRVKNDTHNNIKSFNNTRGNKYYNNKSQKTDVNVPWLDKYLEEMRS